MSELRVRKEQILLERGEYARLRQMRSSAESR